MRFDPIDKARLTTKDVYGAVVQVHECVETQGAKLDALKEAASTDRHAWNNRVTDMDGKMAAMGQQIEAVGAQVAAITPLTTGVGEVLAAVHKLTELVGKTEEDGRGGYTGTGIAGKVVRIEAKLGGLSTTNTRWKDRLGAVAVILPPLGLLLWFLEGEKLKHLFGG